ncbi:DUF3955 domain-containing protein [Lachnospiraceae bacterium LCP25S3_G4]
MKLSCEVIKDLLPLYHDAVCSKESRELVEEHLAECTSCKAELKKYEIEYEMDMEHCLKNIDEAKPVRAISKKLKKDRRFSFAKGVFIMSILATVSCVIAFNVIGSEVLADGTLVEPFALIPLGYLFLFIAIIDAMIMGISYLFRRKK